MTVSQSASLEPTGEKRASSSNVLTDASAGGAGGHRKSMSVSAEIGSGGGAGGGGGNAEGGVGDAQPQRCASSGSIDALGEDGEVEEFPEEEEEDSNVQEVQAMRAEQAAAGGGKGDAPPPREVSTSGVAQELSELVVYVQSVRFKSFAHSAANAKCYEMSSFSESTAERFIRRRGDQKNLVEYNMRQNSRIYPRGDRFASSNYDPQQFWNMGCQMVALNFQTSDLPMQLNFAKFKPNGNCGYILKPRVMRENFGFDPAETYNLATAGTAKHSKITVEHVEPKIVTVTVISGQNLYKRNVTPSVQVEIIGIPYDQQFGLIDKDGHREAKWRTRNSQASVNPRWEEKCKFRVVFHELAMLRFAVNDPSVGLLGQNIIPLDSCQVGYRYIPLLTAKNEPIDVCSLFVLLKIEGEVPEDHADFLSALMNPTMLGDEGGNAPSSGSPASTPAGDALGLGF